MIDTEEVKVEVNPGGVRDGAEEVIIEEKKEDQMVAIMKIRIIRRKTDHGKKEEIYQRRSQSRSKYEVWHVRSNYQREDRRSDGGYERKRNKSEASASDGDTEVHNTHFL